MAKQAALEETPEERIEKLRHRLAEYKDKRETERKAYVEAKMLERWRSECDEVREKEMQVYEKTVAASRALQLAEKEQQRLREEDGMFSYLIVIVCRYDVFL